MKLEVGMYVRYKRGSMGYNIDPADKIGKIINQVNNSDLYELDNNNSIFENDVIKASFNIIDLIKEGDYVNGFPVSKTSEYIGTYEKYIELYGSCFDWKNEDIKSVITHEQMKQMAYKVGE